MALREELGFAAGHTWSGILALTSVYLRFFLFIMGTIINIYSPRSGLLKK